MNTEQLLANLINYYHKEWQGKAEHTDSLVLYLKSHQGERFYLKTVSDFKDYINHLTEGVHPFRREIIPLLLDAKYVRNTQAFNELNNKLSDILSEISQQGSLFQLFTSNIYNTLVYYVRHPSQAFYLTVAILEISNSIKLIEAKKTGKISSSRRTLAICPIDAKFASSFGLFSPASLPQTLITKRSLTAFERKVNNKLKALPKGFNLLAKKFIKKLNCNPFYQPYLEQLFSSNLSIKVIDSRKGKLTALGTYEQDKKSIQFDFHLFEKILANPLFQCIFTNSLAHEVWHGIQHYAIYQFLQIPYQVEDPHIAQLPIPYGLINLQGNSQADEDFQAAENLRSLNNIHAKGFEKIKRLEQLLSNPSLKETQECKKYLSVLEVFEPTIEIIGMPKYTAKDVELVDQILKKENSYLVRLSENRSFTVFAIGVLSNNLPVILGIYGRAESYDIKKHKVKMSVIERAWAFVFQMKSIQEQAASQANSYNLSHLPTEVRQATFNTIKLTETDAFIISELAFLPSIIDEFFPGLRKYHCDQKVNEKLGHYPSFNNVNRP